MQDESGQSMGSEHLDRMRRILQTWGDSDHLEAVINAGVAVTVQVSKQDVMKHLWKQPYGKDLFSKEIWADLGVIEALSISDHPPPSPKKRRAGELLDNIDDAILEAYKRDDPYRRKKIQVCV
jgi:hypothetical protein